MSYDAERAAQTIATPRIALNDLRYLTRRVFSEKVGTGFSIGMRHFYSDAFSNGEPASISPENATDPLSFD